MSRCKTSGIHHEASLDFVMNLARIIFDWFFQLIGDPTLGDELDRVRRDLAETQTYLKTLEKARAGADYLLDD